MKKFLFVISGPSGSGKTTVISFIKKLYPKCHVVCSYTTRQKRKGEIDGIDYKFVDVKTFENLIKSNKLFEYEQIFGNFYGSPKEVFVQKLNIIDIDVNGALKLKQRFKDDKDKILKLIYLNVKSKDQLKERLQNRGHDTYFINKRLDRFEYELSMLRYYDFVILNEKIDLTFNLIKSIVEFYLNL